MGTIIDLILKYLPKVAETINTLIKYAPEATDAIKEMTDFFNRSLETLKRNTELTPEQEAQRDAIIAAHKLEPWWQPDPGTKTPPAKPEPASE